MKYLILALVFTFLGCGDSSNDCSTSQIIGTWTGGDSHFGTLTFAPNCTFTFDGLCKGSASFEVASEVSNNSELTGKIKYFIRKIDAENSASFCSTSKAEIDTCYRLILNYQGNQTHFEFLECH